jgi:hypothetical protein
MTIRADHVAGGVFIAFGILVFAIGTDLPFGEFGHPGAGMMPKLVASLMILFAAAVFAGAAADGRLLADIDWSDRWHALLVIAITAAGVALYRPLGFLVTLSLMVFALLVVVERRRLLPAAAYAVSVTLFAYWLFGIALKAPLERGAIWY